MAPYTTKTDQHIRTVANAVRELFEKGIHISIDTAHFLESTYGFSSPDELLKMLLPPFDCDGESLCDMIFFPDEHQQLALEPVIEENPIKNAPELRMLTDMVTAGPIKATLYFQQSKACLTVEIPETVVRRFVNRLRADRQIDARIKQAIHDRIKTPPMMKMLKVKLRNTRFDFDENSVLSICDFLQAIDENTIDFIDIFMLLCEVLESMKPGEILLDALLKKKRTASEMIRLAEKNEKELQRLPIEAIMMTGNSISAINVEKVRVEINRIDQLIGKMFTSYLKIT
jgi:hypothetical protein